MRHQLGALELWIENQRATLAAIIANNLIETDDSLPHPNVALDNPVNTATIENLLRPARPVARQMAQRTIGAMHPGGLDALRLYLAQMVDTLDANRDLDEMYGH